MNTRTRRKRQLTMFYFIFTVIIYFVVLAIVIFTFMKCNKRIAGMSISKQDCMVSKTLPDVPSMAIQHIKYENTFLYEEELKAEEEKRKQEEEQRKKDLIETIAKVVYAEARGESFTGQVAVAATIMNRLESEEFPNELTKVLEHYTPRYKEVTTEMLEQNPSCLKAAEKAYNGEDPLAEFLGGPTLFFYNPEKSDEDEVEARKASGESENQAASYWKAKPVALIDIAEALAIAFAIVAISTAIADFFAGLIPTSNFGLSLLNGLLGNKYLIMPTLTMLLATIKPEFMGNIGGAQEIGTFLIHIFFAVIGVPASIYLIVTQAPLLLVFCAIIVGMNMIVSFVFGKIFKFNLEEICIASNANIGGPTTAAALAIAKGWQAMVVPALLVGTLGYVIGNYYGIFIGTFLGR